MVSGRCYDLVERFLRGGRRERGRLCNNLRFFRGRGVLMHDLERTYED